LRGLPGAAELRRRIGIDEASRRLLLYFIVPTWVGAFVAAPYGEELWRCYRYRGAGEQVEPGEQADPGERGGS